MSWVCSNNRPSNHHQHLDAQLALGHRVVVRTEYRSKGQPRAVNTLSAPRGRELAERKSQVQSLNSWPRASKGDQISVIMTVLPSVPVSTHLSQRPEQVTSTPSWYPPRNTHAFALRKLCDLTVEVSGSVISLWRCLRECLPLPLNLPVHMGFMFWEGDSCLDLSYTATV